MKTRKFIMVLLAVLMAFSVTSVIFVQSAFADDTTTSTHEHTEGYRAVIKPADCENEGEGGIYCAECGKLYETFTIDALGHKFAAQPTEDEDDEEEADVSTSEVLFIIDNTGSMEISDPNDIRVSLADNIIDVLGENDKVAAIEFGSEVTVVSDFTTDKDFVKSILAVNEPAGKVSMYDALKKAIALFPAEDEENVTRYIVLLTDGTSTNGYDYVSDASAKDVKICTVGIGNYIDENELNTIATTTGGKYFSADESIDFTTVFNQIAEELEVADVVDNSWITTITPYCTTEGEAVHICSRCGKTIERKTIPALGHCGDETTEVSSNNLEVCFLIDESGSMSWSDPDDIRIQVAQNLVDELGSTDKAAVVCFDDSARVASDFTSSKTTVKNAIATAGVYGGTDMYNGLATCFDLFESKSSANKYIVMLTDGDSYGSYDYETAAEEKGVVVFTVGLGSGVNDTELEEIATATGGKYYFAEEATDLFQIYEEITTQIVSNGSTWVTTIIPTCTSNGERLLFCSRCGKTIGRETIQPISHKYDTCIYINDEVHEGTCTSCGVTAKSFHEWSEWTYNNNHTFFKNGTQTSVCLGCNASKTVEVAHSSIMGRIFYPGFRWFVNLFNFLPIAE